MHISDDFSNKLVEGYDKNDKTRENSSSGGMVIQFIRGIIKKILNIFWSKQFLKFGLVGLTNTAVSYTINVLTLLALRPLSLDYDYIIANITAFGLSVLWSYNLNSRIVFKAEEGEARSKGRTLLKTYASYAFSGIVLNNVLGTLWIHVLGISRFISPLLNLVITVPTNFLLNKFWAYANKKQ